MSDNPERGSLDPAVDIRRCCKKNCSSVLSYIGKRTKEGCDCGSEVGTVHSGRGDKGPVPLFQRLTTSSWWCSSRPSIERWGGMARQIPLPSRDTTSGPPPPHRLEQVGIGPIFNVWSKLKILIQISISKKWWWLVSPGHENLELQQ